MGGVAFRGALGPTRNPVRCGTGCIVCVLLTDEIPCASSIETEHLKGDRVTVARLRGTLAREGVVTSVHVCIIALEWWSVHHSPSECWFEDIASATAPDEADCRHDNSSANS